MNAVTAPVRTAPIAAATFHRAFAAVPTQSLPIVGRAQPRPGTPSTESRRRQHPDAALAESGMTMSTAGRSVEPLADDFFRLCHDDRTGGLLLDDDAARIGLASALLGELGWLGWIAVEHGLLVVRGGPLPGDALAHAVLDDIRGERKPRDVRTWLTYLSMEAYDRVARRLVAGNHLLPHEGRRLLRRYTYYLPTDANDYVWPRARLATGLGQRRPLDPRDVHLLGIADATGLLPKIVDWGGQAALDYFTHLFQQAHSDVQALVQETRAVIGNKVMGRR
ncbi:GPP34 family phosphoprotein [Dactylosporangium sp. NPDC051484]|uniref:GOLPH3/VPS74 family protein n=1 Tax=Dactylosporangium sp. NPDC051484 TaxID=3154942 RepID=UPI00344E8A3F